MGEIGEMGEGGGIKVVPELSLKRDDLGDDAEEEEEEGEQGESPKEEEEAAGEIRRDSPSWNRPNRGKVNPPGFLDDDEYEDDADFEPVLKEDEEEEAEAESKGDGNGVGDPEGEGEDGLEDAASE